MIHPRWNQNIPRGGIKTEVRGLAALFGGSCRNKNIPHDGIKTEESELPYLLQAPSNRRNQNIPLDRITLQERLPYFLGKPRK
jgi:hypothetical protein